MYLSESQVLKFLMERNSVNTLYGQVTVGILILQVRLTYPSLFFWWYITIIKRYFPHFFFCMDGLLVMLTIFNALLFACSFSFTVLPSELLRCFSLTGLYSRFAICPASYSWWYFWCFSRNGFHGKIVSKSVWKVLFWNAKVTL